MINSVYTYTDKNGKKYTINPASGGGYMDAYSQYETDRTAQMDTQKANLDATLESNNKTTNANYDNSAKQAYIQYMQNRKTLPSRLQALGVNGGASESGLINLYNNYGTNHATNEAQRNADLTTNQNNRNDAYNEAYNNYLSDLNTQKQTAINNQINEYNNEITRFSSAVQQYPSTSAGYAQYEAWINSLNASSDPLKDIKIALVRQQMAVQFPNGRPSSGGSGGGGGGSSYYSSGGGSTPTTNNMSSIAEQYYSSGGAKNAHKTTTKKTNAGVNRTQDSSKNKNRK